MSILLFLGTMEVHPMLPENKITFFDFLHAKILI